jgi:hypothetical protein
VSSAGPGLEVWLIGEVKGGVGELLDTAVERAVLDQLEVEIGGTLEDRVVNRSGR